MSGTALENLSAIGVFLSIVLVVGLGAFIFSLFENKRERRYHERCIERARIDVKYNPNSEKLKQELEEFEVTYIVNYGKPYKGVKRDE